MKKFKNHDVSNVRNKNNRDRFDSFYTPPYAVQSLLQMEKFNGTIWECASGMGHISKELESVGYKVISSDIQSNKNTLIYGLDEVDFLLQNKKVDNIITNPPYNLLNEFIIHGLKLVNKKMALLVRQVCLCGSQSRAKLLAKTKPESIYFMGKRLKIWDHEKLDWSKRSPVMAHCWIVWNKNYNGETTAKWIL